jgi:glycosyltransferase involved in cell wall biosynthesis
VESPLFASSYVFVLSSVKRMDAFGISLLEGMKTGCAAVLSDLRSVAEVAGDAGLLVPCGDIVPL